MTWPLIEHWRDQRGLCSSLREREEVSKLAIQQLGGTGIGLVACSKMLTGQPFFFITQWDTTASLSRYWFLSESNMHVG